MNINPDTIDAYRLFHEGILAFARAERQGIRVDIDYVNKKMESITRRMERLEREFRTTKLFKHWQHSTKGEVNILSNIQLSRFLYNVKKVKMERETISGQGATDDEALRQMNIPELENLLQIRKLKKTRDTYLEAFVREQVDGYLHPFFNLNFAVSFRSSSDSPNLHNIPVKDEETMKTCRGALYPRPGHQFLEIDFKAIEVAINACYNKDPNLIKYVSDPKTDMHADMTKQIFKVKNFDKHIKEHYVLRQATKNGFVFPEFYGDYYKHCSGNLLINWGKLHEGRFYEGEGIPMPNDTTLSDHLIKVGLGSFNRFENHLKVIEDDFWHKRFAVYAKWKDAWYNTYKKNGYFDLLTGFRCNGVMDRKQACNYPGQGTAFHCLLWSFIQLDETMRKEKWDTRLVNQIHDSVILDINPKELNHVIDTAQEITTVKLAKHWPWIIVPMKVEMALAPVDGSWDMKAEI
jgi:DNA polymerase I-like protein with 3'-5' exonuclease and polymerase domains